MKLFFRAFRDGADEETIICALFHDVGEVITPACHGEVGKKKTLRQKPLPSKVPFDHFVESLLTSESVCQFIESYLT